MQECAIAVFLVERNAVGTWCIDPDGQGLQASSHLGNGLAQILDVFFPSGEKYTKLP
jgi:hypothetical protein